LADIVLRHVQTCQLTRAKRVRPASKFQTHLTRTVDENPLETVNP